MGDGFPLGVGVGLDQILGRNSSVRVVGHWNRLWIPHHWNVQDQVGWGFE